MTTIRVTQPQIDHGTPLECTLCPVALAIQSRLATGFEAYVAADVRIVNLLRPNEIIFVGRLSLDVEARIANYDRGFGMEPFEFELDIPARMLRD